MKSVKKPLLVVLFLLLAAGYIACGGNYSKMGPTAPSYMTPTVGVMPTPTPGGGGY